MSFISDLINKHLTVAEALGDLPSPAPGVTLLYYIEKVKKLETGKPFVAEPWQVDLCGRLEKAFWIAQAHKFTFKLVDIGTGPAYYIAPSSFKIPKAEFDEKRGTGTYAAIHGPPQFGKSIIISQGYPGWILGWDPLHRFRLATYSIFQSARFSVVVKNLLLSPEHQQLFPSELSRLPKKSKAVEWSTLARVALNDGHTSFTALGLQTGFTGTGADTLLMDDPYKGMEEALSEVIRDKTWRFWTDTASPRMNEQSNVFIMFHRYHQDDMGGRAIASEEAEFDLWRYAAIADGDYYDETSDRTFPDPMGRAAGEVLSPRFGPEYYRRKQKNEQVWYSMFQGQPTAKTGKMFRIDLLRYIKRSQVPEIIHWVRAWDNAATDGGGAYTAGVLMGIDSAENVYVFDIKREQVDTAQRQILQSDTAIEDGRLVQIHIPQDPGSAGKDVAFEFNQDFSQDGYLVTVSRVSGTKTMRAYSLSKANNSSRLVLVINDDGSIPAWHKPFITSEMRYFPNSTYKDQIDAASDAYNHLIKLFFRGLVVKTKPDRNLLPWSLFVTRFGMKKIPGHFEVNAAVRIAPDSSKPSGYCITARAAENAHMGERVFVVASARMYVDDGVQVLRALRSDLNRYCELGEKQAQTIWINKGAGEVMAVATEKLEMFVTEFTDDAAAGLLEMNWYLQAIPQVCPFYNVVGTVRAHILVDEDQIEETKVKDEAGMLSLRQDWRTWSYTERGEVQPYGGITLDCLRMTLYKFALSATSLSEEERLMSKLPQDLQPEAVRKLLGTPGFVEAHFAQLHALQSIKADEREELHREHLSSREPEHSIGKRAVTRRYFQGH